MVIAGAGGLTKQLITMLGWNGASSGIIVFEDPSVRAPELFLSRYPVINSFEELENHFRTVLNEFLLGVGRAQLRRKVSLEMASYGGRLSSFVSDYALISHYDVALSEGVCIFAHATVESQAVIGKGTLLNTAAMVSHDVQIGEYCQISPGARLLGECRVGDLTDVGTNAVILPQVVVGDHCIIGAGAVVTSNVPDGSTVVGIPARPVQRRI